MENKGAQDTYEATKVAEDDKQTSKQTGQELEKPVEEKKSQEDNQATTAQQRHKEIKERKDNVRLLD